MECYRQGDVLVVRIDDVPDDATAVPRDAGRLVLAYGEATGHAHAVVSDEAELVTTEHADDLFLRVYGDEVELLHEEHDTVRLPRGDYRVVRQREYTPQRVRHVAD